MKIVCVSDSHLKLDAVSIPSGDVLVHAGDLTMSGSEEQMVIAVRQLREHRSKFNEIIAICGNHDFIGERKPKLVRNLFKNANIIYLHDESVIVDGVKFYGSPYQPRFFDWAFNLNRGKELEEKWSLIPDDVDVLITHGPPFEQLDVIPNGSRVGCEDLKNRVDKVKPKLHVFGHIHHSYGIKESRGVIYANAAVCDERYEPSNPPLVVEI